jgi:uncharacterized protein (DUF3820 family)
MSAVALDLETTGVDTETAKIVEIAFVHVDDPSRFYSTRVNPGILIPDEASSIHGIYDSDVADSPLIEDVLSSAKTIVDTAEAVIGYNVFFDQQILDREFRAHGRLVEWPPLVCSKRLWDAYDPPPPRSLVDAVARFADPDRGHVWIDITEDNIQWFAEYGQQRCSHCGIVRVVGDDPEPCVARVLPGAHGALADARYSIDVLRAQIAEFGLQEKEWREMDPESASWWGPSRHVIWNERRDDLLINFGKHAGASVVMVPSGYWRWISGNDFPRHVRALAHFIADSSSVFGISRLGAEVVKFAKEFK